MHGFEENGVSLRPHLAYAFMSRLLNIFAIHNIWMCETTIRGEALIAASVCNVAFEQLIHLSYVLDIS